MEISGFRILDSLSAELLRPGLTVPAMRNTFKVKGTISNLTGTCPATTFEDAVGITRQMKTLNVNPRMVGLTVGVDLPKFHEVLGRDAEFVYGVTAWVPELVDLRAGGLIPIARQYPGAREFVESYKKEFPSTDLSLGSAGAYGACQILVEAIRRAGSLDRGKLRDAILKMDHNTVYGGFRVDRDGVQIAHKVLMYSVGLTALVLQGRITPCWPPSPLSAPTLPTPCF